MWTRKTSRVWKRSSSVERQIEMHTISYITRWFRATKHIGHRTTRTSTQIRSYMERIWQYSRGNRNNRSWWNVGATTWGRKNVVRKQVFCDHYRIGKLDRRKVGSGSARANSTEYVGNSWDAYYTRDGSSERFIKIAPYKHAYLFRQIRRLDIIS